MTWQHLLAGTFVVLIYARLAWMLVHPRRRASYSASSLVPAFSGELPVAISSHSRNATRGVGEQSA